MVRVVNGEILQDDDPRLQQTAPPSRPSASTGVSTQGYGRQPAAAARAQQLDWNAPPIQLIQDVPGSFMGLPNLGIYGVEIEAMHYSLLALATLVFGWNGFIGGVILLVVMYSNRGAPGLDQPPAGASRATTMRLRPRGSGVEAEAEAAAGPRAAGRIPGGDFLQRLVTQPPGGRMPRQHGPSQGLGEASASGPSSGHFTGTGHKLGSS